MFASLSRGSARARQAYICTSCLRNLLLHHPPSLFLPLDGVPPTASFYSTSTDFEPNNTDTSEPVRAPKTEEVFGGWHTADAVDSKDGKATEERKPLPAAKSESLKAKPTTAMEALRKSLVNSMATEPGGLESIAPHLLPHVDTKESRARERRKRYRHGRSARRRAMGQETKGGNDENNKSQTAGKNIAKTVTTEENSPRSPESPKQDFESSTEAAWPKTGAGDMKPANPKHLEKPVEKDGKDTMLKRKRRGQAVDMSAADNAEKLVTDRSEKRSTWPKVASNPANESPSRSVVKPSQTRVFLERFPALLGRVLQMMKEERERLEASETVSGEVTLTKKSMQIRKVLISMLQEGKLSADEQKTVLKHLKTTLRIRRPKTESTQSINMQPTEANSLKTALLRNGPGGLGHSGKPAGLVRSVGSRTRVTKSQSGPVSSKRGMIAHEIKVRVTKPQPRPVIAKRGMKAHEIKTIGANELHLVPLDKDLLDVPRLSYGLERVLFNPGVYHLQDPRSRVYNFDPYLQTIMPVSEFDFKALKQYITSSKDITLLTKAKEEKKKYTGSTSSMTSALGHFHFLLSQWRPINTGLLSQTFPVEFNTFTTLQRGPVAVFLRYKDGTYAIDADKQYDTANILMMLGKSMEKLLTLSTDEFEKYRKENSDQISEEQRNEAEPFHYTTIGDFLLRSQLDAHDPRLPGTGMFDLKTRAVVSIRMDTDGYEEGRGYQIRGRHGQWESFEREYYDMIRAAFLKYSLQVRMGRMDGIFVAFHNTERIFGFQYISLPEMDFAIHGTDNTVLGDSEFKLSLELLNRVLDRATAKFPEKSLRLHFETRDGVTPFMYIFAEPVEEEEVEKIQATNKKQIEKFERELLGLTTSDLTEEEKEEQWAHLRAKVVEKIEQDELGIETLDQEEGKDTVLNEVSEEEQRTVDDLLATSTVEEDVEEREDEDIIHEEFEEDNEEILGEDEVHDEETEEAVLDDEDESVDEEILDEKQEQEQDILDDTEADESEESEESLGQEGLDEEAASEDTDTVEETGSHDDSIHEGMAAGEESNVDEGDIAALAAKGEGEDRPTTKASKQKEDDLLAMMLIIRNKVDGQYVKRPTDLDSHHQWEVEYALSEVPKLESAHILLEATKRRRRKALTKTVDMTNQQNAWKDQFIQSIKKLNKTGREWRAKEDKIEKKMPLKMLNVKDEKKLDEEDYSAWQEAKQGHKEE